MSDRNNPLPKNQSHSKILAVIPARYASTRFPGKPLAPIQGKPMIQHVWERVTSLLAHSNEPSIKERVMVERVIVATDDERIQEVCRSFGAEVCLTATTHASGTDRVWEVAAKYPEFNWILNVQGDEPLIRPADLKALVDGITPNTMADILTLVTPFRDRVSWQDPNRVKAVLTVQNRALYFSRSPIPYERDRVILKNQDCSPSDSPPQNAFHHLGLYLYRREALAEMSQSKPSLLESLEKLEQLRALEAGLLIDVVVVEEPSVGIDTPEDLIRIQDSFQ